MAELNTVSSLALDGAKTTTADPQQVVSVRQDISHIKARVVALQKVLSGGTMGYMMMMAVWVDSLRLRRVLTTAIKNLKRVKLLNSSNANLVITDVQEIKPPMNDVFDLLVLSQPAAVKLGVAAYVGPYVEDLIAMVEAWFTALIGRIPDDSQAEARSLQVELEQSFSKALEGFRSV